MTRRGRAFRSLLALPLLAAGIALPHHLDAQTGIRNTRHNLSASSPNTVRAVTETEICVFCHTPHGGRTDAPLWNRDFSGQVYTPYTSPSLQGGTGQPNGYSKLCLSCHDGSIALGAVTNTPNGSAAGAIAMTGTAGDGTMPAGTTRIGTNLLNHHPISFAYDDAVRAADGELADPTSLVGSAVPLYEGATPGLRNTLQCTTCHDPHTDALPKFLRRDPRGRTGSLCLTCHTKPGWEGSSHEASSATVTIGGVATAVSAHSCFACHTPHAPTGAERLLRAGATGGVSTIEQTCFQCHQAAGPARNIQGEFAKSSRHDVASAATAGRHRPVFITTPPAGLPENVLLQPGNAAPDGRFTDAQHVECVDCHNPHRATAANKLEGMRGISISGAVIPSVRNDSSAAGLSEQYAVCFRCHGDSYATALPATLPSGLTPRNKRTELQPTNSAYHPVAARGRNLSANLNAQLTPNGLSVNAMIRCTDCHNSDAFATTTGRVVGGPTSPSGPHGSTNAPLLRANYRRAPGATSFSAANFALCFRCHSANVLLGSNSGASTNFDDQINGKDNLHWVHLEDRIDKSGAVCASCHYNVHSNQETTTTQYNIDGVVFTTPPGGTPTRMVNFHPNVRGIGGRPRPEWWFNTATRERRCYLQCHSPAGGTGGEVMNGLQYRPPTGDVP
ncbi:MAG: hypothetical protein OEW77_00650 [Gemmatimonadota bacterium]|nr:hypothetical protein [Gemmatimonadota bacterium]